MPLSRRKAPAEPSTELGRSAGAHCQQPAQRRKPAAAGSVGQLVSLRPPAAQPMAASRALSRRPRPGPAGFWSRDRGSAGRSLRRRGKSWGVRGRGHRDPIWEGRCGAFNFVCRRVGLGRMWFLWGLGDLLHLLSPKRLLLHLLGVSRSPHSKPRCLGEPRSGPSGSAAPPHEEVRLRHLSFSASSSPLNPLPEDTTSGMGSTLLSLPGRQAVTKVPTGLDRVMDLPRCVPGEPVTDMANSSRHSALLPSPKTGFVFSTGKWEAGTI